MDCYNYGTVETGMILLNQSLMGNYQTGCYITAKFRRTSIGGRLGKAYSFEGIKMTYNGYDSSTWDYAEVGAFTSGMTVSTSDNGTDWKLQGEIDRSTAACVFYAPLTARYIRISVPNTGGWYGATLECGCI